jgi:3-carboxy-cis,cis-muconate cycloisomerase
VSGLWDPIFGATAVAATTSDRSWLRAMCDVESALARACATTGFIDRSAADSIGSACADMAGADPADIGRRGAADGNPVIPLVHDLRARVEDAAGAKAAAGVHLGATSQDILDTAAMLVARAALDVILPAIGEAADSCERLARTHRSTPMSGRTLMQQALPTTFGAVAAGWGEGLDRAVILLRSARAQLAVQLGGATGTMAAWYPDGPAVRAAFAAELALGDPGGVWHAERSRVAALATTLAITCGCLAKVATDVVLLSQTELGEVRESVGGGSSSMPHKHNPVAAITARAAAAQASGLAATVLAAMPGELQRAAGAWHAEWQPLTSLLETTGGAAARVAESLSGLQVDAVSMARHLAVGKEPDDAAPGAQEIVDAYLSRRATAR